MAFELKTDEAFGDGLERIARKTLKNGRDGLAGAKDADAIHSARRSTKKARAIVALVEHAARHTGAVEKPLRRAAKRLSPLRDAHAIAETCARVADRAPLNARRQLAAAARSLAVSARRLEREAIEGDLFAKIAHDLRRAGRAVRRAHLDRVDDSDAADAVKTIYRRGRLALSIAEERGKAADFHRWRKRVKTLWYHLRLLGKRWHTQGTVDALGQLEEWLGEDHNVVVLVERLADMPRVRSTTVSNAIEETCRRYQSELRRHALSAGRRLYAESPKAFIRRLRKPIRLETRRRNAA